MTRALCLCMLTRENKKRTFCATCWQPLSGNEGVVVDVPLRSSFDVAEGTYEVKTFNAVVENPGSGVHTSLPDATGQRTVKEVLLGDVNKDGIISITDVGIIIDIILGQDAPAGVKARMMKQLIEQNEHDPQ